MAFKCKIGLHSWNGCKCKDCGKTRDEQHDWNKDCEKCSICGKTRDEQHDWNGCKCSKCGKTRDEEHKWWNGCKCPKCGKTRDEQHKWHGCKCSKCGKTRDEQHEWRHDWHRSYCYRCNKEMDNFERIYDFISTNNLKEIREAIIIEHMNTRTMKLIGGWNVLLCGDKNEIFSLIWDQFEAVARRYYLNPKKAQIGLTRTYDHYPPADLDSIVISLTLGVNKTGYGEHRTQYEVRVFRCENSQKPFVLMTYLQELGDSGTKLSRL